MSRFHLFIAVSVAAVAGLIMYTEWQKTISEELARVDASDRSANTLMPETYRKDRAKPEARTVKGVYLTASSAGSPQKRSSIIDLIDRTELNAVVIDIKDYSGRILYDSAIPLVEEIGAEDNRIGDVRQVIKEFHEHDIYTIARQTVFQDPLLAGKKPEWALRSKHGGIWRDRAGLSWVDPTKREVWEYNVAIAREAIELGFDEMNFDYVRFPSDGNLRLIAYTNVTSTRNEVMRDFYHHINTELSREPAWISLDLFGFVMERHDGMGIGQRLEDAVNEVDYISPMMYPSHYPSGHLGLENPAAHPGTVIEHGMKQGAPYFVDTRASVRPWLQAFHLGAAYGADRIRAQIDAVEKYTDAGWLLWNAGNTYGEAGLKAEMR